MNREQEAHDSRPVPLTARQQEGFELLDQARRHLRTAELFAECYNPGGTYVHTPTAAMATVHADIASGLIALAEATR